uniref:Uncharacterized protein n=1 Tax=Arundo donax TaxID=35708 RepID=A0A0A9AFM1_ARUDO
MHALLHDLTYAGYVLFLLLFSSSYMIGFI